MEHNIIIDNKQYMCKPHLNVCNGYGINPTLLKIYEGSSAKCPHNWMNNTVKGWLDDPSNPILIKQNETMLPIGSYYNYI